MIPCLAPRGFDHASGMLSPDRRVFIVNIPKNASSYINDWTSRAGWRPYIGTNSGSVEKMIVILRDPLERWISGVAQYLNGWILHARSFYRTSSGPGPYDQYTDADQFIALYNNITERLIFDNLDRFDDHVWPQNEIIQHVMPDVPREYFYLDKSFEYRLGQHLGLPLYDDVDKNQGTSNRDNLRLQQFFSQRLNLRPELRQIVADRYQADYDLIAKVIT